MTMQRFLVPMDFSDPAQRALDYAIMLGAHLQVHLTLLHVIQSIPEANINTRSTQLLSHLDKLERELTEHLAVYLQSVRAAGLEGDLLVAHGVPYLETIETAKAHQIDLIVMGSHGRTGLSHFLLGSMAERVLRLAPCSVLIVR